MLAFDRVGSGVPLVLIHAFPLSRRMWERNVPAFSRNFQVITIDLPGFGGSPLAAGTSILTMEHMAREVIATLDGRGVKEPAIFAGVSMGGYVLFQLARLALERVRALVLISTRAAADTDEARQKRFKTVEAIEQEGLAPLAQKMVPNLLGRTTRDAGSPVVAEVKGWIEAADPQAVCAALRGMAARPDMTELLPKLTRPTLVLAGAEDAFVPPAEMEAMAHRLPHREFHTVGKAGHLLNLEQPEEFRDLFTHFLKRRVL